MSPDDESYGRQVMANNAVYWMFCEYGEIQSAFARQGGDKSESELLAMIAEIRRIADEAERKVKRCFAQQMESP